MTYYYTATNPCPICSRSGCTLTDEGNVLCTHSTPEKGDWENGHKCTSVGDWWALWVPESNIWVPGDGDRPYTPHVDKKVHKKNPTRTAPLFCPLTKEERNKQYRFILSCLQLEVTHKEDLERRGLTPQQIEQGMFRSIPYSRQSRRFVGLSPDLPGLDSFGFLKAPPGYLCPIWDGELIVGFQIRCDNPETGKYKWLKGSHLSNGELPLSYIPGDPRKVALCEGILKPFVLHSLLGWTVVGASGGNFPPQQLKEILGRHKGAFVAYFPDAGATSYKDGRPHPVWVRDTRTITQIESLGVSPKIADWGQWGNKESKDPDEYFHTYEGSPLEFRPPEDFKYKEPEPSPAPEKKLVSFDFGIRLWEKSHRYSPHKVVNTPYLTKLEWDINDFVGKIASFKSPTGTGKSTLLGDLFSEENFIILGYRRDLLSATAKVFPGLKLTVDQKIASTNPELKFDSEGNYILYGSQYGLCVDSLWKIPMDAFLDRWVILDEYTSVLKHLLQSKTCSRNRELLIERFRTAIQLCKGVIALDANASDLFHDFLVRVSHKESLKIENKYKKSPRNISLFLGSFDGEKLKKKDWSPLHLDIFESERPVFVISDGQKHLCDIERGLKERGKKGLRLDATTRGLNPSREFLANPDAWIQANKPDYILGSPTIESGIDISIQGYFGGLYLLSFGVSDPDTLHQMMGRVRDTSVPCFAAIPATGLGEAFLKGLKPSEISQDILGYAHYCAKAILGDDPEMYTDWKFRITHNSASEFDKLRNTLLALGNWCKSAYREAFISLENLRGNSIQEYTSLPQEKIQEAVEEYRHENRISNARSLARVDVTEIAGEDSLTISNKIEALREKGTPEASYKAERFGVELRAPGIVEDLTPMGYEPYEILYKLTQESKRKETWAACFAFLIDNPKLALKLAKSKYLSRLKAEGDWSWWVEAGSESYIKARDFRKLQILDFIRENLEGDKEDLLDFVEQLAKKIYRSKRLRVSFGLSPRARYKGSLAESRPLQWFRQYVCAPVGYRLTAEGSAYKFHQAEEDIYFAIYVAQYKRYSEVVAELQDPDEIPPIPEVVEAIPSLEVCGAV